MESQKTAMGYATVRDQALDTEFIQRSFNAAGAVAASVLGLWPLCRYYT
jgi:hypothetical protein